MSEKRFGETVRNFYYTSLVIDKKTQEELGTSKAVKLLNALHEENEQLKLANAQWLDKSLKDKHIRYDNPTCNELTKKYLQLKEENEQLKQENQKLKEDLEFNMRTEIAHHRVIEQELKEENEQLRQEKESWKNIACQDLSKWSIFSNEISILHETRDVDRFLENYYKYCADMVRKINEE